MTDRLDPRDLIHGHWKALSFRPVGKAHRVPDLVARLVVFGVPVALGATAWASGFTLRSAEAILGGLALLTGGLLAVFAQVASWRERLAAREDHFRDAEASDRDSLDEVATHILTASLASIVGVVASVIGLSLAPANSDGVSGFWCGVVTLVGTYVVLTFAIVIFKLYDTYTYVNRVSPRVNGSVKN